MTGPLPHLVNPRRNELAYLSATEALRHFRSGDLSPVELLNAVIARAELTEPTVNAFAERLFDEALAQAHLAATRYLGRGDRCPGALEGIPVAIKEHQAIAGRTVTAGSLLPGAEVPTENAPIVDRVCSAGGIIHARTTMPEFGIATFTHSRRWGITRNPWNPDYSPGGSSGGAAASLAAGSTTLATGSDVGGSIRIPAAFTGTVGFRPPHGRIAAAAPNSANSYYSEGPLTRTVDDCILFANSLIGPDPRDHASLRPGQLLPMSYTDVTGVRVALCVQFGDYRVHPEIEANTRAAARALGDAGATVEEIALPWTQERVARAVGPHFAATTGPDVIAAVRAHRELVCDYTLANAGQIEQLSTRYTAADGIRVETAMQRELAEAMAGYDALVCPTTTVPGFLAGDDMSAGCVVDGYDYGGPLGLALALPFNIAGRCPVLNVPSGVSSCGLPTGMQIVGHTFDDAAVFRIGRALEPWWTALCWE